MTSYIEDFYTGYDEESRFASQHGQVEFLTTMHYIEKYLFPEARILEIGAATGRYSHALALQGYQVNAVEFVPRNIEVFESKTLPDERVEIRQGDARDLSFFSDDMFDITLILGPLYHLYTTEDKKQAISEAMRVTKPGGIIFAAFVIVDGALIDDGIIRKAFDVPWHIAQGKIDLETFAMHSEPEDLFELVRKEDIDELMSGFDVTRLHYVAVDMLANPLREAIDEMDEDTFSLYMKYHFAVCERPDLVGATQHSLDIFKKGGV